MHIRILILAATTASLASACAGSLTPAVKNDLEKQLAMTHDPIAACYAKALEQDAHMKGKLYVKFRIDQGAKTPTGIEVSSSDVKNPELDKCVMMETQDLRLAEAPEITIAVTYPLDFKLADPNATAAPVPANATPAPTPAPAPASAPPAPAAVAPASAETAAAK